MSGTAISSNGGGTGKIGNKAFVKGSRGSLIYLVRADVAQALADKDGGLMPMTGDAFGRIPVKDVQIADLIDLFKEGITIEITQAIKDAFKSIKAVTHTVSCPRTPIEIPGIGTDAAYAAGDCLGTLFEIEVPTSGVIYSASYYGLDDETLQVNFEIFKARIPSGTDNLAWSPADSSILNRLTRLAFFNFEDQINSQTSELLNIGKAYTAPRGKLWFQGVAQGALTIPALNIPRVQLQILSDDPEWQER